MIDLDTNVLIHNGCMPLRKISEDTMVYDHYDDLLKPQIGAQRPRRAYKVVLSDRSSVIADKDHIFGGLAVKDIIKWAQIEYEIPQPEPIDFLAKHQFDWQSGVDAIFDIESEHLPEGMLYATLSDRQQVFEGMQDGFRDIDGGYIATTFNATYAEDIANLCRSLGHDAEVVYNYKGIKYWNIVIKRGPRKIVAVEPVGKRNMLEITNVVTDNYIAL